MIIAQISDSHIFLPEPSGTRRLQNLATAVEAINNLETQPDVVTHTGDISHNASEVEYQAAHDVLAKLKAPLFVIPGNRDRRQIMRRVFSAEIGLCSIEPYIQYKLDQWDTTLLFLDTLDESDRLGEFCTQRMKNLADMLNVDSSKPIAIFMHHPPYDVVEAPHPFQFDSQETVQLLNDLLSKHSHIMGIYCGHSHRATTGRFGEIPALTIPSLSIDLRFGKFPDSDIDRPIFYIFEL